MHTRAMIAYVRAGSRRPRYYANDLSRDVLDIAAVETDVTDARAQAMTLDGAGFTLMLHRSAIADFADRAAVEVRSRPEIVAPCSTGRATRNRRSRASCSRTLPGIDGIDSPTCSARRRSSYDRTRLSECA